MSLMPEKEEYTYEDWLEMDDNENIELLDGVIYRRNEPYMRGEPSDRHMDIVTALIGELYNFLKGKGKQCKLYTNPYMVKLNNKTIVHPDVLVVCDKNKMTDKGCVGAPELIIEVLSLSNAGDDLFTKYNHYLMAGVKEYWIVDPIKNNVRVYLLDEKRYREYSYFENDIIPINVLPGCEIDLKIIFDDKEPE